MRTLVALAFGTFLVTVMAGAAMAQSAPPSTTNSTPGVTTPAQAPSTPSQNNGTNSPGSTTPSQTTTPATPAPATTPATQPTPSTTPAQPGMTGTQYPNVGNLQAFSADANYMSLSGYLRYLTYQQTNSWLTKAEAVRIVQQQGGQ